MKLSRIQHFSLNEGANDVYQKIDIAFLQEMLHEQISLALTSIYLHSLPEFDAKLSIKIMAEDAILKIPKKAEASLIDTWWACPLVFSHYTLDEFYTMYSACLGEHHVVIITENLTLLTATV